MNIRTCVIALAVAATLPACAQTPAPALGDDPALAFLALEGRLTSTDVFAFTVSMNEPTAREGERTRLDGSLQFGTRNQIRIETNGEVNGLGASPGMVSDGSVMSGGRNGIESDFPDFTREFVPEDLRSDLVRSFARWGASRTLMTLVSGSVPGYHETEEDIFPGDPDVRIAVANASWGLPETFDGTAVRPLTFTLAHPYASEATVTLWLELETGLPRRRTVRLAFDSSERITEEVYSEWTFERATTSTTFSVPE